jgi:predicted metal-dependent HD superfamily phosphohydrolase
MLKRRFEYLCVNYLDNKKQIDKLWIEIEKAHSHPKRYYHTLEHLEHLYQELEPFLPNPILEFTIFYHDIIYNIYQTNNEEQSALVAKKRLNRLGIPYPIIEETTQLIYKTQTHLPSSPLHTLFLDADLSILGSDPENYKIYTQNIRKEYHAYHNNDYIEGRWRVLENFMDREQIYKSDYFYKKYEKQAQQNIIIEYNSLTKT